MTKIAILILALVALNSCDSGSSEKAKPQTDADLIEQGKQKLAQAATVADVTKTVVPDRIQLVKANLSYDEQKEMRTIGCKITETGYSTDYQLDPETEAGDVFRNESVSDKLTGNNSYYRTVKTVKKIHSSYIYVENNHEVLDLNGTPFKSIDEVFTQKPHYISEISYSFKNEQYPDVKYDLGIEKSLPNLTPAAAAFLKNEYVQNPTEWDCSIDFNSNKKSSMATDKINYNFMGRPTEAFHIKSEMKGKVTCKLYKKWNPFSGDELKFDRKPLVEVDKGTGTMITNSVVSNKYRTTDLVSCGGEELYRSELLVLDTGEILRSSADKKLNAPIRLRQ